MLDFKFTRLRKMFYAKFENYFGLIQTFTKV